MVKPITGSQQMMLNTVYMYTWINLICIEIPCSLEKKGTEVFQSMIFRLI